MLKYWPTLVGYRLDTYDIRKVGIVHWGTRLFHLLLDNYSLWIVQYFWTIFMYVMIWPHFLTKRKNSGRCGVSAPYTFNDDSPKNYLKVLPDASWFLQILLTKRTDGLNPQHFCFLSLECREQLKVCKRRGSWLCWRSPWRHLRKIWRIWNAKRKRKLILGHI